MHSTEAIERYDDPPPDKPDKTASSQIVQDLTTGVHDSAEAVMEISKVNILVYPCWATGAIPAPKAGIIERTGMKVSYTRRASEAQRNIWKRFVDDIAMDESRLLLIANEVDTMEHFHDSTGFYSDQFRVVKYAQEALGNRCHMFLDKEIGVGSSKDLATVAQEHVLADRIAENGFHVSPKTESLTYGHHRGDCTINVGRNTLASLGLNPDSLKEHKRVSVTSHQALVREIVKKYSPDLFAEIEAYEPQYNSTTGETTVNVMRTSCRDARHSSADSRLFHFSVYHWLFLTHTPLQIKHLIKGINSVEELFEVIGIPSDISGYELHKAVCKVESTKKPILHSD